ncbi:MAG: hypothetical protein IT566_02050 [Rhodospirillaceae bacterium]|nr:hypothetical protein [Rhodospirillaceae bacterium]
MTSLKALFGLALLGLFVGLWLRGEHYAARARTSEALLTSAVAVGNANAEVARLQALQTRKIDAVASVNALKKRDLRMDSDTRRKVIRDAPPDADGPLAPVLRDQLDRLPKPPRADARGDAAAAGDPVAAAAAQ